MEKTCPGRKGHPTALPWADQLFFIFLTKFGEPFTWETKKFVSATMVNRLGGSPFFHGKVAFLAVPTFLHITRSRWYNQSMCKGSWLRQRGQFFNQINARWGCLPAFGTGGPYQSSVKKNSTIYLNYYARQVCSKLCVLQWWVLTRLSGNVNISFELSQLVRPHSSEFWWTPKFQSSFCTT